MSWLSKVWECILATMPPLSCLQGEGEEVERLGGHSPLLELRPNQSAIALTLAWLCEGYRGESLSGHCWVRSYPHLIIWEKQAGDSAINPHCPALGPGIIAYGSLWNQA